MNGFVLKALRAIVLDRYGRAGWEELHEMVDETPQLYIPSTEYPDDLVDSLVDVTVEVAQWERAELLAELGRTLGPELLTILQVEIKGDWSALGVVEQLDRIFERTYDRPRFSAYEPPALSCSVAGEERVFVELHSHAAYCALFAGIVEAIGEAYGQPLSVAHHGCFGRSDGTDCTLLVSVAGPGAETPTQATSTGDFEHPGA